MTPQLVNKPVLETDRLVLRLPEPTDLDALAPFVMSDRSRFVGGGADEDRTHAWRILALLIGHWTMRGFGVFVCERKDSGRAIGSMGPWFPDGWPEPELSWTVWDPDAEGKGFASEAVQRIRRSVYEDLGWSTAVSYIDPENTRSIALAERLGCRLDTEAAGKDPSDLVYRHPSAAEVLA